MELPPRTRRIPIIGGVNCTIVGTTSAHAENTVFRVRNASTTGNYLRARGEYLSAMVPTSTRLELPPRTRRILGCSTIHRVF